MSSTSEYENEWGETIVHWSKQDNPFFSQIPTVHIVRAVRKLGDDEVTTPDTQCTRVFGRVRNHRVDMNVMGGPDLLSQNGTLAQPVNFEDMLPFDIIAPAVVPPEPEGPGLDKDWTTTLGTFMTQMVGMDQPGMEVYDMYDSKSGIGVGTNTNRGGLDVMTMGIAMNGSYQFGGALTKQGTTAWGMVGAPFTMKLNGKPLWSGRVAPNGQFMSVHPEPPNGMLLKDNLLEVEMSGKSDTPEGSGFIASMGDWRTGEGKIEFIAKNADMAYVPGGYSSGWQSYNGDGVCDNGVIGDVCLYALVANVYGTETSGAVDNIVLMFNSLREGPTSNPPTSMANRSVTIKTNGTPVLSGVLDGSGPSLTVAVPGNKAWDYNGPLWNDGDTVSIEISAP